MAIDNRNMDILEVKTKTALVRSRIPGVEYVINPYIDHAMVDPLNYREQVARLFLQHGWDYALTDEYAGKTGSELIKFPGKKTCRA